ncbi:MAG: hypothetical protein WDN30_13230 [Pararobbsia sp.]
MPVRRLRPVIVHALALAALVSVAACGSLPEVPAFSMARFEQPELRADRAAVEGKGFSKAYVYGHVEGCGSGYKSAGNRDYAWADDSPTLSGADYFQGWYAGFAVCRDKYTDYANPAASANKPK